MPVQRSQSENIQQTAADPELRVRFDPHPDRDPVRRAESDPVHIFRQTVRIAVQDRIKSRPVFFINTVGKSRTDAELLHIHDGFPHAAFQLRLLGNKHRHMFADAFDLCQTLRFFLYDSKCICLEFFDDALCKRGADPPDRAPGEIPFDGICAFRGRDLK